MPGRLLTGTPGTPDIEEASELRVPAPRFGGGPRGLAGGPCPPARPSVLSEASSRPTGPAGSLDRLDATCQRSTYGHPTVIGT